MIVGFAVGFGHHFAEAVDWPVRNDVVSLVGCAQLGVGVLGLAQLRAPAVDRNLVVAVQVDSLQQRLGFEWLADALEVLHRRVRGDVERSLGDDWLLVEVLDVDATLEQERGDVRNQSCVVVADDNNLCQPSRHRHHLTRRLVKIQI